MKVPIGKLAKIVGLSPGALRFYEEKGLISSERSEAGWRYYEKLGIIRLLSCKKYASMGLSLKTITKQLSMEGETREMIRGRLENQRNALLKKARELEDMAAIVGVYENDITNIERLEEKYEIVERTEMCYVSTKSGELLSVADEVNNQLSKWIKKFPAVRISTLFHVENGRSTMGYTADAEYAKKNKLPTAANGISHMVFKSGKYYHTIQNLNKSNQGFEVEEAIAHIVNDMREKGLSPGEYAHGSLIVVERGPSGLDTFFDIWIQMAEQSGGTALGN